MGIPTRYNPGCSCCGSSTSSDPRIALPGSAIVVPFSDAAPITLGTPPTGANVAEIHVEGGHMRFTTDGQAPSNTEPRGVRVTDYGRIELESSSEIAGFKALGQPGQSGTLYVEFFTVPTTGNI